MALNKALKTDLSALAQIIQSKGRGRDTVLAHITPQEAALLKKRGGRGSINPDTGLPEFEDEYVGYNPQPVQFDPAQYAETIKQQDFAQTPANPYKDTSLYPGGVQPTDAQATVYGSQAPYNTPADQPVVTAGTQFGPYEGEAMGGPAYVGPATAFLAGGKELPVESAFQVTPQGTAVQPTEQTSTTSDILKQLRGAAPNLSNEALARLGLAGGLGVYGALQGRQAATQSAEAAGRKSALAAPYKQEGQELIRAAQAGELTPANQQVIQQQRARLAQASSNMGGVGQQQIENQISNLTSQLIENQYKYGLQVLQIGDNIELGAINTQLQLDQQLNAANKSFYTSLAQLAAGSPMYVPGLYSSTPTRT